MSEHDEQVTLIEWCDFNRVPIFAIPNGGKRNAFEAKRLKNEGVRSGIPDLFVPVPSGEYHGLFIEMKYGSNKPTLNQKIWMNRLDKLGYQCVVAYNTDDAITAIERYLSYGRPMWRKEYLT